MDNGDNETVTSIQVRAARALRAWSQKDLAAKAGVAVSTIADFERGQRTPVANNLAAIRKSLEESGIIVRDGGVVDGSRIMQPPPSVAGGVPLRWVEASDLSDWANSRNCQEMMPELISRLIRAELGPAAKIRLPSEDSIQQSGWDGLCELPVGFSSSYVPSGTSGWEIGTQRAKIREKANTEYKKRTGKPLNLSLANSTFVFVTPRRWSKKSECAIEKKKEGIWADVRALDADDLVHWIELYPGVSSWLAAILGKRPVGIRDLDEVWREWSYATRPPLSEELTTADRDEEAAWVLQWLYGPSSVFAVEADSPEEATAFFYAILNELPTDYRVHYLSRTIVISNSDEARFLSDSLSPLIFVLDLADPGFSALLAQHGHHVLLTGVAIATGSANSVRLAQPFRETIRNSLNNMGVSEDAAQALARDCGRSIAVLRRLIPSAPGSELPRWANAENARAIIPALLLACNR